VVQLKQQAPDGGLGGAVRNLRDELPPHY